MSNSVDNRIVEMRFDNKQFQSGVQDTLNSLNNLKESLKFKGVTDTFSDITKAASKVSLKGMSNEVENVIMKIPLMSTVWDTTVRRMTNSFIDFIKRTSDGFSTLTATKSGFSEYELKMGSVQTIMASTGESIEVVDDYLEELNLYADRTIYSFSDMTQNIGKFTNAGVKLDKAVAAIKGVSNVAAVSGANTNEASRAMYNFAQALSAGYVKLIDWKSIENANMATVEFKQQLIDTAVAQGTLTKTANGYITAAGNEMNATRNFNETLQDQWMTSEVLIETLNRYSDETTEIGKKAYAAAQDIKTFSQMIDTLKEALQSGWSMSFQYIFGNLEEAKKLWTSVSGELEEFLTRGATKRNDMLKYWSTNGKILSETVENNKEAVEKQKAINQAAKDIWLKGMYGSGEDRRRNLEAAGFNYDEVQAQVDKLVAGIDIDSEKVEGSVGKTVRNVMSGRDMMLKGISNLWTTFKRISFAFRQAWEEVFPPMTGQKLVKLSESFMNLTEKIRIDWQSVDNLRRTFRGLFAILDIGLTIIKAVVRGIGAIFKALPSGNGNLLKTTAIIGDMIWKFDQFLKSSDVLGKIFEGIGTIIGTVIRFAIEGLGLLVGIIKDVADKIDFSEVFSAVADSCVGFVNNIVSIVNSFKDKDTDGVKEYAERVKGHFGIFTKIGDFLVNVWGGIKTIFWKVVNFLAPVASFIKEKVTSIAKDIGLSDVYDAFMKGGAMTLLANVIMLVANLRKAIGSGGGIFTGIKDTLDSLRDALASWERTLRAKTIKDIAIAVALVAASLFVMGKMDDRELLKGSIAIAAIGVAISKMLRGTNAKRLMSAAAAIAALGLTIMQLSLAVVILGLIKPETLMQGIAGIGVLLFILTEFIKAASNRKDLPKIAAGLIAMAFALRMLVAPVIILGQFDLDVLAKGVLALGILMLELVVAFALLNDLKINAATVAALVALTFCVRMLIVPLIALGELMDYDAGIIFKGLLALGLIMAELIVVMITLNKTKIDAMTIASLVVLTLCIRALLVPLLILGAIKWTMLLQGVLGLAAIVAFMTAPLILLSKFTGDMPEVVKAITAFAAVIVVLMTIVIALTQVPEKKLQNSVKILAAVMLILIVPLLALIGLTKILNYAFIAKIQMLGKAFLYFGAALALIGAALALVIAAVYLISKIDLNNILFKVATVGAAIFILVKSFISGIIYGVLEMINDIIDAVFEGIIHFIRMLKKNIRTIVRDILAIVTVILEEIKEVVYDWTYIIVTGLLDIIVAAIIAIADNLGKILDAIIYLIDKLGEALQDPERQGALMEAMVKFIEGSWSMAFAALMGSTGGLFIFLGKLVGAIVGAFDEEAGKNLTRAITDFVEGACEACKKGELWDYLSDFASEIAGFFENILPPWMTKALNRLGEFFYDLGGTRSIEELDRLDRYKALYATREQLLSDERLTLGKNDMKKFGIIEEDHNSQVKALEDMMWELERAAYVNKEINDADKALYMYLAELSTFGYSGVYDPSNPEKNMPRKVARSWSIIDKNQAQATRVANSVNSTTWNNAQRAAFAAANRANDLRSNYGYLTSIYGEETAKTLKKIDVVTDLLGKYLGKDSNIYLDGKTLVGGTIKDSNDALNRLNIFVNRGAK